MEFTKYEELILEKGINLADTDLCPADFTNYHGGYGIYQMPRELALLTEYLMTLDINTYVEVGIWQGGTFRFLTEMLLTKNPELVAIGIDIKWPASLTIWLANAVTKRLMCIGRSDIILGRLFDVDVIDVVLIDGGHEYHQVKADYLACYPKARYIIFADIVNKKTPDVNRLWRELKQWSGVKVLKEIIAPYYEYRGSYGFGIIKGGKV